ncbi:hypothetical protein K437DRAFT_117003 [Tilletiaria anomala UBC 951]|uniref:Uncharacterized protein n=1 Tax=Tilletiaria anomala (strain ATCC 24038 / CBS 436.72 / UBC 951) TaxID=1037660 RepID=A0A066WGK7_TILAU|nr:uncharacterized protein K437DRAFT_117003 [Tilletiaria anomala UBC 951]KDN53132.1 hypothetical protein K437DRAFT_117003 [Tilletiaria anomala UBC 951]
MPSSLLQGDSVRSTPSRRVAISSTITSSLLALTPQDQQPRTGSHFCFATTTPTLSQYNCGVHGIPIFNAGICVALSMMHSFMLAGVSRRLAGALLQQHYGATLFCTYGMVWCGLAMFFILFFIELSNYNGDTPGIYLAGGIGAADAENASHFQG